MTKLNYNLQDAVDPQNPQPNEKVNATLMNGIRDAVNDNRDDFDANLMASILTDGMVISGETKTSTFYYFGSPDITVLLASTIPNAKELEFINLGSGSITFDKTLQRAEGSVLPGTSNGRSSGKIIKYGGNYYGAGDFVGSAVTLPSLQSAVVLSDRSNVLLLNFDGSVTTSILKRAFTIKGMYRAISFLQSSGATIEVQLSDHVIPNTELEIVYKRQYGNLNSAAGKLLSFSEPVDISDVSTYDGTGTVYYVSDTGNNGNNGLTEGAPKATFAAAVDLLGPGDYALFKRGDSWTQAEYNTSGIDGTASEFVTIGTYGSGALPQFNNSGGSELFDIRSNYMIVYGLEMPNIPEGNFGIRMVGDLIDTKLVNCRVNGHIHGTEDIGAGSGFGIKLDGSTNGHKRTEVLFCYIEGFREGFIMENGTTDPGFIAFNEFKSALDDNLRCINGNYNGITFAFNECYDSIQDQVDFYNGSNIIFEYGNIHSPRSIGRAGNGIKYGGPNSSGNIIRYNYVHDIYQSPAAGQSVNCFGITSNGCSNGQVYGNLVVRTLGRGIDVATANNNQSVHHNTCIDVLNGFGTGGASGITLYNNIFQSRGAVIDNNGATINGGDNIFIGSGPSGSYSGQGDITNASLSSLFVDHTSRDFHLRSGSQAINAGRNVSGYTKDRDGNALVGTPDIGCYEFTENF